MNGMATMRAVGFREPLPVDDERSLLDIELPRPRPEGRDLLVAVRAVSVNPVDTKVRNRAAPRAGAVTVLGWDASGIVAEVGRDVRLFQPGDQVFYAGDLTRPGSNAEFQLVDERIVGPKPESLTHAQAAALPLTSLTAWELLFDRLRVTRYSASDERLLIVGAAGGVGSILTQLAAKLTGATVIGTASRDASRIWVQSLGADAVIDHSRPLKDGLAALGFDDVTLVASLTHTADHFADLVDVLRPQGRLGLIDDPERPLDPALMKRKSLSLHWEFVFTRSMFYTEDRPRQHEILTEVSRLVDSGTLRTTASDNYGKINAANLRKAHAMLESHRTIGKIVLVGF